MYYPSFGDCLCISISIVGFFIAYLFWYFWKYAQSLGALPTYPVTMEMVFRICTGRFPGGISFATYFLNELKKTAFERFQKEGLTAVWFFDRMVFVFKDEYMKIILNDPSLAEKTFLYNIVSDFSGNGLLIHESSKWKKRRKLINPAFRLNVLKDKVDSLNRFGKEIVRQLSKSSGEQSVEVVAVIQELALRAACECFFGMNVNDRKLTKKIQEITKVFHSLGTYTTRRFIRPWLYFRQLEFLFQEGREHKKLYRELRNFTKYVANEGIKAMNSHISEGDESKDTKCNDKTLTRILFENHLKDSSFTMRDIEDEAQTILYTGHESTSCAMLWCLYMLGLHPEIQERAFEEVQSVAGSSDADISYGDLNNMRYLESVIKENTEFQRTAM